mmetsp:Transcript_4495/g.8644  ORF Transcript_4495/g.8644 Transcript_4495/m.8644 type:complete len:216 (-) Transcript_4495:470-1117(-)
MTNHNTTINNTTIPLIIAPNGQNSRHITTSITIIWRTPHRHQFLIEMILFTLHHQLMSPRNQIQSIDKTKLIRHPCTKQKSRSSRTHLPWRTNILRITPDQITKCPLMRNFLLSINRPYLIQRSDIGRKSPMNTQNLRIDNSRQGKGVKALSTVSPYRSIAIFSQTFIVKSINLGDLSTLVIAPEKCDVARIFQFETQEECERFDGIMTTVDEIA